MNTYEANQSSIEKDRRGNGEFGFKEHGEPAGGTNALVSAISPGLAVSPGAESDALREMAALGLQGSVEPYNGNDPDVPGDAVVYQPAGAGYSMVLGNLGRDDFIIYDDLDTDGEAWRTEPGAWTAGKAVRNIGVTRFQREARDELYDQFSHSDEYEFRDASMWKDDDGDLYSQVNFTNEEGTNIDLTYDFTRDEFSARDTYDQIVDPDPVVRSCLGDSVSKSDTASWFRKTAQKLVEAGHGKYIG